jgi:hypothetical protein
MASGGGRPNLRSQFATQVFSLGFLQAKHEVLWEAAQVALHLLIYSLCGDLVKLRQVSIQHDLLSPNHINPPLHDLNWDWELRDGRFSHLFRWRTHITNSDKRF